MLYMLCHCSQETSSSNWEDLEKKNLVILTPHYIRTFALNLSVDHAKNRHILNFTEVSLFVYRAKDKTKHTCCRNQLKFVEATKFWSCLILQSQMKPTTMHFTNLILYLVWVLFQGTQKSWLMPMQNLSQGFFSGFGNLEKSESTESC